MLMVLLSCKLVTEIIHAGEHGVGRIKFKQPGLIGGKRGVQVSWAYKK